MTLIELQEKLGRQIEDLTDERKPEITKAIRDELSKKVNYTKFVDAFISNVANAINNIWVPRIEVNFENRKDC